MKHRTLALLLAACLLLGILAACGSAESAPPASSEEAQEEAPAEEAPEEAASAEDASTQAPENDGASAAEEAQEPAEDAEEPAEDAEASAGTFTGAIPAADSSVNYPIDDAGITLSFWSPFNSNMPGVYDYITDIPAVAAISEATGVEIDWTTVSGMEMFQSFNLMAASGDYCDLVTAAVECYSGGAVGALDDGIIVDLTDYIEENCPEYLAAYETRNATKDIVTDDGRYACLYGAYDSLANSQGYVIRQDWLEDLGLESPETYDDYFDVLSAFKDAYGCTDAFMMDETSQDEYHTSGGFGVPGYKTGMFGAGSDLYQVDGEVRSSFNQDGYRDYLREMHRWFEAGLFSADFVTLPSMPNHDSRAQLIASENSGIWYVGATSIEGQQDMIGGDAKITGILDPRTTPGEKNHFSTATIINTQCNVSVSTDCDNIEAALQYLNYYFTDEGIRLYNYGVEGESYEMVDGELRYTDLVMNPVAGYTPYTMSEAFVLVGYVASVTDPYRANYFASDAAVETLDLWNEMQDNAWSLPKGVALSSEESGEASALQSDIYTYVAERIPQFILGTLDIESDWDGFVSDCEDMGLGTVIDIYQAAYDRYAA